MLEFSTKISYLRAIKHWKKDYKKLSNAIRVMRTGNPSELVKKLAVRQNGNALQFIDNPSEEIRITCEGKRGSLPYNACRAS
jgi:hypothetical protein